MAGTVNPFDIQVQSANLTTATTTYTSGDQLGDEITLTGVGGTNNNYGVITSITVVEYSRVLGAFELRFFRDTTTPAANNAAAAWSDADATKLIPGGVVMLPPPSQDANNGVIAMANLWIPFRTGSSHANLYMDMITRTGNAVFAGGADSIRVNIGGHYYS